MGFKTKSLRRQLDGVRIEYNIGITWSDGHVTNKDNVTRVGKVEFWEEDGDLYAYGLPMTATQAVTSMVKVMTVAGDEEETDAEH